MLFLMVPMPLMLSEETTLGEFPVEAVEVMTRVARKIERDPLYIQRYPRTPVFRTFSISDNLVTDAVTR
jgi:pyruvate kinase